MPNTATLKERTLGRMRDPYVWRLGGTGLIIAGAFLLGEHVYNYGLDWDLISHDWYGFGLIILGMIAGRVSKYTEKLPS